MSFQNGFEWDDLDGPLPPPPPQKFDGVSPLGGGDRKIGGSVLIDPGVTPLQTIIRVTGTDDVAQVLSCTLSIGVADGGPEAGTINAGTTPRGKAVVRWGAMSGLIRQAVIDVLQGTGFSVVASFLQVDVGFDDDSTVAVGNLRPFRIGGWCGYGVKHSKLGAQRTVYYPAVISGQASNRQIPAHGSKAAIRYAPVNAVATMVALDAAGGTLYEQQMTGGGCDEFPIANDCATLRLSNTGGVNITAARGVVDVNF